MSDAHDNPQTEGHVSDVVILILSVVVLLATVPTVFLLVWLKVVNRKSWMLVPPSEAVSHAWVLMLIVKQPSTSAAMCAMRQTCPLSSRSTRNCRTTSFAAEYERPSRSCTVWLSQRVERSPRDRARP